MSEGGWHLVAALETCSAEHELEAACGSDSLGHHGVESVSVVAGTTAEGWAQVASTSVEGEDAAACLGAKQEESVYSSWQDFLLAVERRGRPRAALQHLAELLPDKSVVHVPGEAAEVVNSCSSGTELANCGGNKRRRQTIALNPKVPETEEKKPRIANGYCLTSVCGEAFMYCIDQVARDLDGTMKDEDYVKLHAALVSSGSKFHLASSTVLAESIGVDRSILPHKVCRLAASQWLSNRLKRVQLKKSLSLASHRCVLVAYAEALAWDETPLKCSLIGDLDARANREAGVLMSSCTDDLKVVQKLGASIKQDGLIRKVLQTQQWVGYLVQHQGQYMKILFEQVCPLQVLEKNSSEVLQEALLQQSGATLWSSAFHWRSHLGSFDKAGSNSKAFLSMGEMRDKWYQLMFTCEVHDLARAFKSTFDGLVPQQVTGMVSCALSLRHSGALALFRDCVRDEIRGRLKVMHGSPSAEATAHKEKIMETMFAGGSKSMAQMLVLSVLPNGDWRSNHVEHYLPYTESVDIDMDALAAKLVSGLLFALVAKKPSIWARHRWTGCEIATEELALMESVHNLLSTTFFRYVSKTGNSRVAAARTSAHDGNMHDGGRDNADDAFVAEDEDNGQQELNTLLVSHGEAMNLPETDVTDKEINFQALNAAHRRKACTWLASHPLDWLCLCRLVMQPMTLLLQRFFQVSSEGWEISQRASLAAKLEKGLAEALPSRAYMVQQAADGLLEEPFFSQIRALFSAYDTWKVISDVNKTVEFNHMCFKMLSRCACYIHSYIRHVHQQFPFKLFKLLVDPHLDVALSKLPKCAHDSFTSAILEAFPGFAGEQCRQMLHLVAMLSCTTIVGLESRHSSIRRQCVMKSIHTWTEQFKDLSANWTLQQLRRAMVGVSKWKPSISGSAGGGSGKVLPSIA
eukprot:2508399-Amphidinium_carterae.1